MFLALSLATIFKTSIAIAIGYFLCQCGYNVLFHPLRHYPGPKLWAMTRIPYTCMFLSGKAHIRILEFHKQYGPVVRIAPEFLSMSHEDAMKETRDHRKDGKALLMKEPIHHADLQKTLFGATRDDHTRYRRAVAHGFSAKSMQDQQPLIQTYISMLMRRLREQCDGGSTALDMVKWFNYATFDVIGDLSFGESFGCLENSDYHPWVALIFDVVKDLTWRLSMKRYTLLAPLLKYLIPKQLSRRFEEHSELSRAKLQKRLATLTDRPDFIGSMIKARSKSENSISLSEIETVAAQLIIAGSETTATTLSATTYYLTRHPHVLATLCAEVRSSFSSEKEINLFNVQNLRYMMAVINESMRMYPATPGGQPRQVDESGAMILGQYVPGGTKIEIWQWALYHNPRCFTRPDDFIPERWLDDPHFAADKKDAFQPFSVGPRSCIGRNLAYAEMHLIIARLVWNFDIRLAQGSDDWDQRSNVLLLWEKPGLYISLEPREISS
ncbi:cytochrome P450 [Rhizodiscina lignyota]|uniref:Cytochrome P450 n=1 Tax=Rhizodiscina lignyota TaxID=1504668 RepID=A0A9P4M9M4_9PEZI|nr:cytochrome P450 [Rhizodiscina lignyota]